jgi:hypothetical protein
MVGTLRPAPAHANRESAAAISTAGVAGSASSTIFADRCNCGQTIVSASRITADPLLESGGELGVSFGECLGGGVEVLAHAGQSLNHLGRAGVEFGV